MALHTTNPGDTKRQMNLAPFMEWSATQQYNVDDLVVSSSGVWKAKITNRAQNPDENTFWTKVVGGAGFSAGGCLEVSSTSDNSIEICGSTAGAPVRISSSGTDTDVDLFLQTKSEGATFIPQHTTFARQSAALLLGVGPVAYTNYYGGFGANAAIYSFATAGGIALDVSAAGNSTGADYFATGLQASGSNVRIASSSITVFATGNANTANPTFGANISGNHYGDGNMTGNVSDGQGLVGLFASVVGDGGPSNLTGTIQEAAAIRAFGVAERGNVITKLYGLKVDDINTGTSNYAIHTGFGTVQLGSSHINLANLPSSNPNVLGALYMTTTARLLAVSSG